MGEIGLSGWGGGRLNMSKAQINPPKFMFVMFDMYVKLQPEVSPIAVNKLYFN